MYNAQGPTCLRECVYIITQLRTATGRCDVYMAIGISNNVFMESEINQRDRPNLNRRPWESDGEAGKGDEGGLSSRNWSAVSSSRHWHRFASSYTTWPDPFRGFPRSPSLTGTKISLHASHEVLPVVTSKFHPYVALPMLNKNFTPTRPFQRQYQNQFLSCAIKP